GDGSGYFTIGYLNENKYHLEEFPENPLIYYHKALISNENMALNRLSQLYSDPNSEYFDIIKSVNLINNQSTLTQPMVLRIMTNFIDDFFLSHGCESIKFIFERFLRQVNYSKSYNMATNFFMEKNYNSALLAFIELAELGFDKAIVNAVYMIDHGYFSAQLFDKQSLYALRDRYARKCLENNDIYLCKLFASDLVKNDKNDDNKSSEKALEIYYNLYKNKGDSESAFKISLLTRKTEPTNLKLIKYYLRRASELKGGNDFISSVYLIYYRILEATNNNLLMIRKSLIIFMILIGFVITYVVIN
ncbi:MAG: hypothetical protein MHMPM18_002788, partial [Marteilia pararefringens]